MLRTKVKIGQISKIPGQNANHHNPWSKWYNLAFLKANLVVTNLIWAKLNSDFFVRAIPWRLKYLQ
jgi:hypothetical protein